MRLDKQACMYYAAIAILLAGLAGAVLIYFMANDASDDASRYESNGDMTYTLSPEDSKRDMRQMEEFGGKANVLIYKFRLWFAGLWHGKSLAVMVGFMAVILACGFRFAADRAQADVPGQGREYKAAGKEKDDQPPS
jgi:hypothetical protein